MSTVDNNKRVSQLIIDYPGSKLDEIVKIIIPSKQVVVDTDEGEENLSALQWRIID